MQFPYAEPFQIKRKKFTYIMQYISMQFSYRLFTVYMLLVQAQAQVLNQKEEE